MAESHRYNRHEAKRFKPSHDNFLPLTFQRETFNKNFPNFQKPKVLGDFSVDGRRRFCSDRSQLKFFDEGRFKNAESGKFEKVELDLNVGLSKTVRKSPECKEEKLDHMLR